jgi:predicted amino acid dehydrogenase
MAGIGEKLGMTIVPKHPSEWLIKHLHGRLGFTVCSRFDVFGQVEGIIIAVLLTAKQMVSLPLPFVRQRILDAVLYAQNHMGVEGIGLGAYTAPLTAGGRWLANHPAVNIWVTHGDSYAVALTLEGIEKVANLKNLDFRTVKIAIVGAYGLIGEALSQILIKKSEVCDRLILIGRKKERFARLSKKVGGNLNGAKISDNLADARKADLIIAATTGETAILKSEHLKRGAIVYDISQPINLRPDVCAERPDIIRVDGTYAQINGIELNFEMGPPKGATFGCLAETIMQALTGDKNHHVGFIEIEHVNRTMEWAKEFGFSHAPLTNFSQPLITTPVEAKEKYQKKHSFREALAALRMLF